MKIKLSRWAKENDMTYVTAWRLVNSGKFPYPIMKLDNGGIYVDLTQDSTNNFQIKSHPEYIIYSRVSSHDQKEDLKRQQDRLKLFCAAKGFEIKQEVSEIGSGLNGKRKKLLNILEGKDHIVIEHRDRLVRFGFEYIEAALKSQGRTIIVMNKTEENMDLVQDFIDVVTSLCSRIYGKRSAKNKTDKIVSLIKE